MAKIKAGNLEIEGEAAEINSIIKDQNFDLNKYLDTNLPKNKFKSIWLIVSVFIFFALCCCEYTNAFNNKNLRNIESLAILLFFGLSMVLLQLKLNNPYITTLGVFFGTIIILVSFGVYTPKDAAKDIRKNLPGTNSENNR